MYNTNILYTKQKALLKRRVTKLANLDELKQYKNIHMLGIGGTSMSGIAEILRNWNFNVTGSDSTQSENTDRLIKQGIKVTIRA